MSVEKTKTYPFSIWDVEVFEKYLGSISDIGWHLKELQPKLYSRFSYVVGVPNSQVNYRIWLSEKPIDEKVAQMLANQGWEKVTVLSNSFFLRKYYFNIYKSLEDSSGSEKVFDDQLKNIYSQLENVKLKTTCNVLLLLLSWLVIMLFFRFMNWRSPLPFTAAVFPFAIIDTIYTGRTMVDFSERLKAPKTNILTQEELDRKTKEYRNMKIFGFVLSAALFIILYFSPLGI